MKIVIGTEVEILPQETNGNVTKTDLYSKQSFKKS
jgi:hypothetical protein